MGANNSTAESTHAQLSSLYLVPSLYPRRHSRGKMYQALHPAFLHEFKGHAIIARKGGGSLGTRLVEKRTTKYLPTKRLVVDATARPGCMGV